METSDKSAAASLNPLTSFAEGTPASHSAKPGSEQEAKTHAIFGPSSPALFAYFDRNSCCWKTSQATLVLGLEVFSETWPDSGTMRNGSVYELRISAPPTCERESLLWPTAQRHDAQGAKTPEQIQTMRDKTGGGVKNLNETAANWPTARREDGESAGNHPGATDSLTGATRNWMTPHGMHGTDHTGKTGRGGEFAKQATQWTPRTITGGGESAERKQELGREESGGGDLQSAAQMFPTPAERDYRTPNKQSYQERSGTKKGEQLQNFVEHSPQAQATTDGQPSSENGPTSPRRLNPRFVEWLMGFPPRWTEL